MPNVLGIVAEYNPFHNGHLYHINESKEQANADYVIAVISGNFVQRGDVSIIDKWAKAEMALRNGVDLVIELPTLYSISSAENFAYGSIRILNSLDIINAVSFGAENADIDTLDKFADVLYNEPKEFISVLNHELSKGISYPKARENALLLYLNDIRRYANVLSSPNNILGIEYLKALKKLKSNMIPIAIPRANVSHNSKKIVNGFASATTIREMIVSNKTENLYKVMPESAFDILADSVNNGHYVDSIVRFEKEILYTLRKMSTSEIAEIPDVSEGLENLIKEAASSCNTIEEFIKIVKSKRYTLTRIHRILVYVLLGVTKKDMILLNKTAPYIRILGATKRGTDLISAICSINSKINVITSPKKFIDSSGNKNQIALLQKDIFATDIYTLGFDADSKAGLDFTKKFITI